VAEGISPHSGGTVPDLHRVPQPLAVCAREPIIGRVTERRPLTAWAAVVLWMGVIFAFSSIPHLSSGLGTWDYVLRKGAHMTEYGILAMLLARALGTPTGRGLPVLTVGIAYAASDELHQHFVRGRHASPIDVGIDTVGLLIGLYAYRRAVR